MNCAAVDAVCRVKAEPASAMTNSRGKKKSFTLFIENVLRFTIYCSKTAVVGFLDERRKCFVQLRILDMVKDTLGVPKDTFG